MQATIHVKLEESDPMMIIGHLTGGITLSRQGDFSNFTFLGKVKIIKYPFNPVNPVYKFFLKIESIPSNLKSV